MSLRLRLLLALGAVAVAALLVADITTYRALHSFLYARVDQSLDAAHFGLERALVRPDSPFEGRVATVAPGTFVEVRDSTGAIIGTPIPAHQFGGQEYSPRLPERIDGLVASAGPGEARRYLTVASAETGGPPFRVRVSALSDGSQLIVASSLLDTAATLRRLLTIELAVTVAALVAAVALGSWLVRIGLRPLGDVEATAAGIADGHLDRRVPGEDDRTEVGRLARALNTMLGRIQDAVTQRDAGLVELRRSEARLRRFVADASHELRTPLAAVSGYAELFERGARDRPEDLARVMKGIRSETTRMGDLVEDLLLLARLDESRPMAQEAVELYSLAEAAIDAAVATDPAWPVDLDGRPPVEILGDKARIRQVLDNLLANVRAHTPPSTQTEVRISSAGDRATVEIADHGPGLDDDALNRVFERFWRADASRSRDHGGSGLGLAIVAAIVGAHGGEVSATKTPGGGATFTVRLPIDGAGGKAGFHSEQDLGSSPAGSQAGAAQSLETIDSADDRTMGDPNDTTAPTA